MKRTMWILILALGLVACGAGTTMETSPAAVEAPELDLSGVSLDVHQAPG